MTTFEIKDSFGAFRKAHEEIDEMLRSIVTDKSSSIAVDLKKKEVEHELSVYVKNVKAILALTINLPVFFFHI